MKKIVIIGAGPAGITAAYQLVESNKNYNVTILEESNEVGGISRTVNHNGNRMDIGGHRFFSKDDQVNKWWDNILPGIRSNDSEDKTMLTVERISRILYDGDFYDYPVKLNKNTIINLGPIKMIVIFFSYLKASIFKREEKSLEDFYINRFGKKLYSMFFEHYTEKVWGVNPSNISPDWGKQRVKGLSIKEILSNIFFKKEKKNVETSLIEEFKYPKFGPGQLWEEALEKFLHKGGTVKKGCKVISLHNDNDKINEAEYIEDGVKKTIKADIFLSSMPLRDLVDGLSNVPQKIKSISEGLQYRDYVTVGLLVNKSNIIRSLTSDCWIYVQDKKLKLGRIQIYNNWSKYLVNNPEEYIWFGLEYFCNENDEYWNMNEEEWKELAASEFIKLKIINKKEAIDDYNVIKVKKAYPAYFGTYDKIEDLVSYLNKYENLYCIGRNGQHRYNNMDHSMVTAFEAVKNINLGKVSKENVWNVNIEQEYHESK